MDNIKVPVLFQPMQNFNLEDVRFTKVKIWLMHLGENFNGSRFSEEAVTKAIPTLAYTPIMGLIKEEDFLGHEMDITLKNDGDIEFKNLTQAYGVIPEFNNAQFEDRVGDDGVTRTYLTVEGLLWNKWEEAIDVISSKRGKTGQSMEIIVQDFSMSDDDIVDIDNFQFDGACLLGDAVPPAMVNSTVELAFSDKTDKIIKEKLAIFAKSFEKGGNDLAEDKKKDEEIIEETTKESEDKKVEEKPKAPAKKAEAKKPIEKEDDKSKGEDKKPEEDVEIKEEEPEAKVIKEETVAEARKEQAEIEEKVETPADRIIVGEKSYSIEEAATLIEDYHKLLDDLHKDAVDELFAKYGSKLTEEDVEALKVDAYTKSIDELETLIFATIGKNQFSKAEETKEAKFSTVSVVTDKKEQDPYNGVLTKYLNK